MFGEIFWLGLFILIVVGALYYTNTLTNVVGIVKTSVTVANTIVQYYQAIIGVH